MQYGLDKCCRIIADRRPVRRLSWKYLEAFFLYHVQGDKEAFDRRVFQPVFDAADDCDAAFSIGGDNYCYGEQRFLFLINRELRRMGRKTILWGCSIEPDAIKGELLEDLKGYQRIFARESLTYEALVDKGLSQTVLTPDPAFFLRRHPTPLPDGFIEGDTVGVNISPMILSYSKDKDLVLANYTSLIDDILQKTSMSVALIPHVVWQHDDDRIPLRLLYDKFRPSNRVFLVEDRPAEQLKDLIARCRFMVAARTHASIAAYSEQVPTLVVGYSVKAQGIAKDLFGEHDPFVIPVQAMSRKEDLSLRFHMLLSAEKEIRRHFQAFIPDYLATRISPFL